MVTMWHAETMACFASALQFIAAWVSGCQRITATCQSDMPNKNDASSSMPIAA